MRVALKFAVVEDQRPQREIGAAAGITASRMSDIVRGWANPTDAEQSRLAAVLERDKRELFSE